MRVLDLGDVATLDLGDLGRPAALSPEIGLAGCRLATYLAWPENEARRQQYLSTWTVAKIDKLQKALAADQGKDAVTPGIPAGPEAGQPPAFHETLLHELQLHGGFGVLVNAPGLDDMTDEINRNMRGVWAAGLVLFLMRSIDHHHRDDARGGASVLKAIDLIEEFLLFNRTDVFEHWRANEAVRHIGAAMIAHIDRIRITESEDPQLTGTYDLGRLLFDELGITLAYASQFAEFGANFRAHGQKFPVLDRSKIWTIPPQLRLPDIPSHIPRLPDRWLPRLKGRKANIR
jgi:hypothetical protein